MFENKDKKLYQRQYGNSLPILLKIGGGTKHPLWVNMPNEYFFKKDDITLDYKDNSVKAIYITDLIEKMPNGAVISLFKECFRVLERYGHLRISARNCMYFYYAMMNNDKEAFDHVKNYYNYSVQQLFINEINTQLSEVNYIKKISDQEITEKLNVLTIFELMDLLTGNQDSLASQSITDSINWFNLKKIEDMLSSSGFKTLIKSMYGQSNVPIMRNVYKFDNVLPTKSLFYEVRKH